jgi:hypothetical protein
MRSLVCTILALLLLPLGAWAQGGVRTTVEQPPVALTISGDAGVFVPTDSTLGDGGFAYGFRVGLNLASWLGVEARYLAADQGNDDFFFNSGSINLKLMAATSYQQRSVTPYISGGIGMYRLVADGESEGIGALFGENTNAEVPLGVGLMIDLGQSVSLGGEFTYHFLLDEDIFDSPDRLASGDVWDITANLNVRL